jgi:hypothetical protein
MIPVLAMVSIISTGLSQVRFSAASLYARIMLLGAIEHGLLRWQK